MAKPAQRRTAVLVDPHPLWLEALELALGQVGVETVGRLTSPREALALVAASKPDLLIVDPDAGDDEFDGLECIRQTKRRFAPVRAIAVSGSDGPERIRAAFAAGAIGYFVKMAPGEDLATAVRQAFEDSSYVVGPGPPSE